ncbi:hypothetical protein DAEQUDRAFT_765474 [Daedalea quercina L-15889]|uniref:Cytochrome P450 n=1 Tax=Daedalea quercina L-15889 TaxID=1314783 RepID=A0A165QF77_9APHY|nr:hypothetical protein DAEQUDRAFT_765474 [Daedalea quercina L-15889]
MTRDEVVYEESDEFKPTRFFDIEYDLAELRDPRKYAFGHRRRICPGRFLGDRSAWLAIAYVTATFDVRKARDSVGREITPTADFLSGFIRHPKHFCCDIKTRSEKSAELIVRSF